MTLNVQSPKDSINKSYLQENIKQEDFTRFGSLLNSFFGKIELSVQKVQTEENMKNLLKEFLESAFYRDRNELNTKSYKGKHEADLVIHNGILAAKQANPQADTSPLEREIDMLVYRLYGLTEDEIRIVEGEK